MTETRSAKRAVVVGAGPAGIAAASVLADAGASVTLVDEAAQPGGQIYRQPAHGLQLNMRQLLGQHLHAYEAFHRKAQSVCERVDYRPSTLVWNVQAGEANLVTNSRLETISYDTIVLATGATDRIMPVKGWTLPGVFSLGGAQALLKSQGCLIGRRTVFCGSSPLLYLAAMQYVRMGGTVAAIIDTTAFSSKLKAVPHMMAAPGTMFEGVNMIRKLRQAGVRILNGTTITAFAGTDRVTAVIARTPDGSGIEVECDSVAYGHGLRPENQLAEVAGSAMRYDPLRRFYTPDMQDHGLLFPCHYLCGDGGVIGGAHAAELSGALAGAAAVRAMNLAEPTLETRQLQRKLDRLLRFQKGLAVAFAWPQNLAACLEDEVTLCRCEQVTVGAVRASLSSGIGIGEANRVKAATRCGMGRCQGRFCGHALAEVTAAALEKTHLPLGRLRAQAPIKPLPIAAAELLP